MKGGALVTPSRAERFRHNLVLFGLVAIFVALGARLYYVQVLCHDQYLAAAEAQTRTEFALPAPRGAIIDCRGRPMALSIPAYLVAAYIPQVRDREETAARLAPLLGTAPDELLAKLQKDRQLVFLKRRVPVGVAREIEKAQQAERAAKGQRGLAGIVLLPDSSRSYANERLACHLLGHTNIDDRGAEGAELAFDQELVGTDGRLVTRRDGRARVIALAEIYREPVPGNNLRLTIDVDIQQALEDQLAALADEYSPAGAFGVVLDPETGRVLAMASWPNYNPNKPGDCEPASRLNRNVCTVLEPGSTFKPFVLAALLEEGAARPTDTFFGENGAWRTGGRVITDAHGYGTLSLTDGVVKSSNIIMAKAGERLGPEGMWRYCHAFGFGQLTGLGLSGECEGMLRPVSRWQRESLHSIAFGHEISVTPIQLAAAYAALANGGRLYVPQYVLRVENARGETVRDYPPKLVGQVISPQTSATVRDILTQVVERGTGTKAKIEEYANAGKTGTARKLVNGHYSSSKHFSSFVGMAPADKPRMVALITVDEPQKFYYGGTVAAPAVAQVLREGLASMGVAPRPDPKTAVGQRGK
jgi:cell division protein FtsI (penicillin-binding protein 3)